jgi:hypothetical protein
MERSKPRVPINLQRKERLGAEEKFEVAVKCEHLGSQNIAAYTV